MTNDAAARLRQILAADDMLELPGAHDVLSARLVESVGFPAVYVGGMTVAAVDFGLPDVGVISYDLLLDRAARVVGAVDIPVVIDLDNAGGNPLTIRRAVQRAEAAGVAAVHIEDVDYATGKHLLDSDRRSVDPSRDSLLPLTRALGNLNAALQSRTNKDTAIIARTDALATHDLAHAIERAQAFADAGADLVFIPYLRSVDVRAVTDAVDCPLMMFPADPFTAQLRESLAANGVRVLLHPSPTLMPAFAASLRVLEELRDGGIPSQTQTDRPTRHRFREVVRWPEWTDWALGERD